MLSQRRGGVGGAVLTSTTDLTQGESGEKNHGIYGGKHVALYFQNRNQTINTLDESCSLNIELARLCLMIVHNPLEALPLCARV